MFQGKYFRCYLNSTMNTTMCNLVGSGLKSGSGMSTPGVTIFFSDPSSPLTRTPGIASITCNQSLVSQSEQFLNACC